MSKSKDLDLMGKTTLYHPISLHVIRGAAEYCGWKFGKIKQLDSSPGLSKAHYEARIELMPRNLAASSLEKMQDELQKCFMDDIRVHWLHKTRRGLYACRLSVSLGQPPDPDELIVELEAAGLPF
jgi:hypothetical protein